MINLARPTGVVKVVLEHSGSFDDEKSVVQIAAVHLATLFYKDEL